MKRTIKPISWCTAALVLAGFSSTSIANAQSATLESTWTYASGSSGWIPDTVSIGNEGQRVFSAVGTFGASARLFSESSTPIATDAHSQMSYHHMVDSSESCARRAWLHYRSPNSSTPASPELRVYDTDSSAPSLTYTFPFTVNQPFGGTQMSPDGSRVYAWVFNHSSHKLALAVFDNVSSTPIVYANIDTFLEPDHGKLSRDGSRMYLETGTKTFIVDTTNGTVLQSMYNFSTIGNAHAISPDGDVFAQSTATNDLKVFRRQGSTYSLWFTHHLDGAYACSDATFSGDGNTLVATFDGYNDQRVRIVALDLQQETPVTTFDHEVVGGGSLSLATSDLEVNYSGTRIFVGTWGDELGLVPEVMVFSRSAGAWSQTHSVELSGSVRDLDIDHDGLNLAVASKTVHATQLGGGGRYDRYALTPSTGMRLVGTPTAGGSVAVHVSCPPDQVGLLLASDALAATPTVFPGVGQLFLRRDGMQFLSRTTANASGELVFTIDLGDANAGDTLHVQGLFFGPRRLTPGALTIEVTN